MRQQTAHTSVQQLDLTRTGWRDPGVRIRVNPFGSCAVSWVDLDPTTSLLLTSQNSVHYVCGGTLGFVRLRVILCRVLVRVAAEMIKPPIVK